MTDFEDTDLQIQNFSTNSDLLESGDAEDDFQGYVHIRIQQRNGRKTLTTCQGLPEETKKGNLKVVLKAFKKKFCCNGTIVEDPELGQIIQLQGDQRENIKNFLAKHGLAPKNKIKVHGF